MTKAPLKKVGILFGGRSSEHDVSLRSAGSVYRRLDRSIFEPKLIYIDRNGTWHWGKVSQEWENSDQGALPEMTDCPEVILLPRPHRNPAGQRIACFEFISNDQKGRKESVDLLIPMLHGKNCEDGTLQGLMQIADVPFTGAKVLGSAIAMDKEVSKKLAEFAGIPVVPYRVAYRGRSDSEYQSLYQDTVKHFGLPLFVKACGEGSSVGVYKIKTEGDFLPRLKEAFQYDEKVLIEKGVNAREIEYSVIQNRVPYAEPWVSQPAEIIPNHEFYSYEAKYLDDNGATFHIPARLSPELNEKMTQLVKKVFLALECRGYARVDLFLDQESNAFFLNEVNTLPGFTSISMFPKLCEISGIPYTELLTRLIDLALANE